MTFDEVKKKAWQRSQKTLLQWQKKIKQKVKEKSAGINHHFKDLSILYGKSIPEKIVVSLQYYPKEGNQKGEPISNFVETGRLKADIADVLYWVSTPSILPSDTLENIKAIYNDNVEGAIQRILHEIQHSNFQKEKYKKLINTSEQNPKVLEILSKLDEIKGNYIEVTNELITSYLENLGKKRLDESQKDTIQSTPLIIEVDREKHGKVIEAVIKEDIRGWRDKGTWPGPYTDLRQSWEKELGNLPKGYQTKDGDMNVTSNHSDKSYMGVKIYQIARNLDTSLIEKYVNQGKMIDKDFVVELYRMVDSKIETNK